MTLELPCGIVELCERNHEKYWWCTCQTMVPQIPTNTGASSFPLLFLRVLASICRFIFSFFRLWWWEPRCLLCLLPGWRSFPKTPKLHISGLSSSPASTIVYIRFFVRSPFISSVDMCQQPLCTKHWSADGAERLSPCCEGAQASRAQRQANELS